MNFYLELVALRLLHPDTHFNQWRHRLFFDFLISLQLFISHLEKKTVFVFICLQRCNDKRARERERRRLTSQTKENVVKGRRRKRLQPRTKGPKMKDNEIFQRGNEILNG